jgi:SNF2 family DNA or RNA helicase
MTLTVRQRQILACPQELGLKHRGAAIDTIIEHSHLRLDENCPIVVFTPFRKALPWLSKAFMEEYPDCKIYEIRGQLTAQEFGAAWMGFQNDKYKKKIMLCVIKSGASFQATVADTAYFLGCEYDFNLNEQAEDRLNRMGQKNFVNIFYIMTKGTVDEEVAERLNEKKDASNWVVGSEQQYLAMLRRKNRPRQN